MIQYIRVALENTRLWGPGGSGGTRAHGYNITKNKFKRTQHDVSIKTNDVSAACWFLQHKIATATDAVIA